MIINSGLWFTGSTYAQIKKTINFYNFAKNHSEPKYILFGSRNYYKNILEDLGLEISKTKQKQSICKPLKNVYDINIHEDIKICEQVIL